MYVVKMEIKAVLNTNYKQVCTLNCENNIFVKMQINV